MERWLQKNTVKPSEEPSTSGYTVPTRTSSGGVGGLHKTGESKKEPSTRRRQYQKEYIKYGFTCQVKNEMDHPQCVLCGAVLANESLKPVKIKRHFENKHTDQVNKTVQFFQRKETELLAQKTVIHGQATLCTKALAASYEVAHLNAKAQKPHTIGENLILPAAIAMTSAMHGEKIASALKQIPLSNDTISNRINDIAGDIKCQLIERAKIFRFSLQLDESTDLTSVAQLMVFIRYSHEGKFHEDTLFCCALEGRCTFSIILTVRWRRKGCVGEIALAYARTALELCRGKTKD